MYMHITMAKELDLAVMENCVCFNLRAISRAITQFYVAELGQHGLLPTQTPILTALSAHPDATMAQLSEWLGMDRTTLVRNLRPLERDRLVRLSGKGRGGKVSLALTTKGQAALIRLLPDWLAAQRAVVKTLGAKRWTTILADLERAATALQK